MKPVESNVSPYLQQPLRTLDEVREERERRQREFAELEAKMKQQARAKPAASAAEPAGSPAALHVDQTA